MKRSGNRSQFIGRCLFVFAITCCFIRSINTDTVLTENDQLSNDSQQQLDAEDLHTHVRTRRSYGYRRWRIRHRQPRDVMMSDATRSSRLVRCGEVEIDPQGALCCDGLVYSRRRGSDMRCCQRVAYDHQLFACCGPAGSKTVVQRSPVMPACCDQHTNVECSPTESRDRTGLGSVCCRTQPTGQAGGGGWRCCLRSDRCCEGASETVDVPGYRPACCQSDMDTAARCCARTYESVGLLPQCCDNERLRPICCRRPDGSTRCCPANYGYCCGLPDRTVPSSSHRRQYQSDAADQQQSRTGDSHYDNDRYPTVIVPADGDRTTHNPGTTTLHSVPATCCYNPSRRCCSSSSSSGRRQTPCCRAVCCRSSSSSASSCCSRQNAASASSRCGGQGSSGSPCCQGQGTARTRCCSGSQASRNRCCSGQQQSGGQSSGTPCCSGQGTARNRCCSGSQASRNRCCSRQQQSGGQSSGTPCCSGQGDTAYRAC